MAWEVSVVVGNEFDFSQLEALVRGMPVWVQETPASREAAEAIWPLVRDLWLPEDALTLFKVTTAASATEICVGKVPTLRDHHCFASCIEFFGVADSEELREGMLEHGFVPVVSGSREGIAFRLPLELLEDVREISLDSRNWLSVDDVFASIFAAVGAPDWHGKNFNALNDSIATGGINRVEVPYRLIVRHASQLPGSLQAVVADFAAFIGKLKQRGCPVQWVTAAEGL